MHQRDKKFTTPLTKKCKEDKRTITEELNLKNGSFIASFPFMSSNKSLYTSKFVDMLYKVLH